MPASRQQSACQAPRGRAASPAACARVGAHPRRPVRARAPRGGAATPARRLPAGRGADAGDATASARPGRPARARARTRRRRARAPARAAICVRLEAAEPALQVASRARRPARPAPGSRRARAAAPSRRPPARGRRRGRRRRRPAARRSRAGAARGSGLGRRAAQLGAQRLGDEPVVAEALARVRSTGTSSPACASVGEHARRSRSRSSSASHSGARERCRPRRCAGANVARVGRQVGEQLVADVVGDEPVGAAEAREAGLAAPLAEEERRQRRRRPASPRCAAAAVSRSLAVELVAGRAQQRRRLRARQRELARPELDDQPLRAHARDGQRGPVPGRDGERRLRAAGRARSPRAPSRPRALRSRCASSSTSTNGAAPSSPTAASTARATAARSRSPSSPARRRSPTRTGAGRARPTRAAGWSCRSRPGRRRRRRAARPRPGGDRAGAGGAPAARAPPRAARRKRGGVPFRNSRSGCAAGSITCADVTVTSIPLAGPSPQGGALPHFGGGHHECGTGARWMGGDDGGYAAARAASRRARGGFRGRDPYEVDGLEAQPPPGGARRGRGGVGGDAAGSGVLELCRTAPRRWERRADADRAQRDLPARGRHGPVASRAHPACHGGQGRRARDGPAGLRGSRAHRLRRPRGGRDRLGRRRDRVRERRAQLQRRHRRRRRRPNRSRRCSSGPRRPASRPAWSRPRR